LGAPAVYLPAKTSRSSKKGQVMIVMKVKVNTMKYETPELTPLTPAIDAIQTIKISLNPIESPGN
jgi:hypothetical protein